MQLQFPSQFINRVDIYPRHPSTSPPAFRVQILSEATHQVPLILVQQHHTVVLALSSLQRRQQQRQQRTE